MWYSSWLCRSRLACVALAAAVPLGAAGQEPPLVVPGAVATAPVSFTPPPTARLGDTVLVRVISAEEIALFGPEEGVRTLSRLDGLLVPVTVRIPRSHPAGVGRVANVEIRWRDGTWSRSGLEIMVEASRSLALSVDAEGLTLIPGASLETPFSIRNDGNVKESVTLELEHDEGWRLETPAQPFTIPPNSTASGTLRLEAPRDEPVGRVRNLVIVASGQGSSHKAYAPVFMLRDESWGPSLEHLPGTVFLGVFSRPDTLASLSQLVSGVTLGGLLGRETHVAFRASHYEGNAPPESFRSLLPPSRPQLSVGQRNWRAVLGDAYFHREPLGTRLRNGRGLGIELNAGRVSGDVMVSRPWVDKNRAAGHLVLADVGVSGIGSGRLALVATDASQTVFGGTTPGRSQVLGARYSVGRRGFKSLELSAGWMRVTDEDGLQESGPAAAVNAELRTADHTVDVRAAYVPASLTGIATGTSEVLVAGSRRLFGPLRFLARGWYFQEPLIGRVAKPTTWDGSVGLGVRPLRTLTVGLNYRARRDANRATAGVTEDEHSIQASADLYTGAWSLNLGAERGTVILAGNEAPALRFRSSLRYASRRAGFGVSLWRDQGGFYAARSSAELHGQVSNGLVTAGAGMVVSHIDGLGYDAPLAWANLALEVTRGFAVVLGVEENPRTVAEGETRFSLGIRKDFALPLPIRRQPLVSGHVFDDLDNDGARDPGEPGVEGVRLTLGPAEIRTDRDGAFEIHGEAFRGFPLKLDAGSLADGMIRPPGQALPSRGDIGIPVVRTVRGVLSLYLDANGNGARDPDEQPAAGTQVTLTDARGRDRVQVTDRDGRLRLSALPLGSYRAVAVVPAGRRNDPARTTFEITARRGEALFMEVGIEDGARQIRSVGPGSGPDEPYLLPTFSLSDRRPKTETPPAAAAPAAEASTADPPAPRAASPGEQVENKSDGDGASAPLRPTDVPPVDAPSVPPSVERIAPAEEAPSAGPLARLAPPVIGPVKSVSVEPDYHLLRLAPAHRIWASSVVRRRLARRLSQPL